MCGDDIKYIYTMRMNGDRLEFIVDADTEEGAAIGEEYEIYDEIAEAFDGNATVDSEMTSDEWGDFIVHLLRFTIVPVKLQEL